MRDLVELDLARHHLLLREAVLLVRQVVEIQTVRICALLPLGEVEAVLRRAVARPTLYPSPS